MTIGKILILATILRLSWYLLILFTNPDGFWMYDSYGYWNIAYNVKEYGIFSRDEMPYLFPDYFRTPLYPLLILPTTWFDFSGNSIPLITIAIDSFTCWLMYRIVLKIIANDLYAKIAALIYACHIQAIVFSNFVLAESTFAFLLCLFTLVFLHFSKTKKLKTIIWLGIVGGLAVMCKPVAFILIFPTGIFILILHKLNSKTIVHLLIFSSCFYAVQFPWMQRNKNEFGRYFNSVLGEHLIYGYHAAHVLSLGTGISYEEAKDELIFKFMGKFEGDPYKKPYEYAKLIEGEAYSILWKYKGVFLKEHSKECVKFFLWPMKDYITTQIGKGKTYTKPLVYGLIGLQILSTVFLLGSILFYLIHRWRKKLSSHWLIWYLIVLWLIFVQFNTMPYTDGRIRFPFDWSFIVVAVIGLALWRQSKSPAENQ